MVIRRTALRRSAALLASLTGLTVGLAVVAVEAAPAHASSSPSYVQCIAPATGPIGATGPKGATGATGPAGDVVSVNGAVRQAHLSSLPLCSNFPGVCAMLYPAVNGMAGPTGATGPQGDTAVLGGEGPSRLVHRRFSYLTDCTNFPTDCRYPLDPPHGATGPIGDTGVRGPQGATSPGGPSRQPRGGLQPGSTVTLALCGLPNTGGGISPVLQWGGVLLAAGVVVLVASRRRRLGV
jgi:LPXTG-motif cell wall-anchored protein